MAEGHEVDTETERVSNAIMAALSDRVTRLEGATDARMQLMDQQFDTYAKTTATELGKQFDLQRQQFDKMLEERDRRVFGTSEDGSRALTFAEALDIQMKRRRANFWTTMKQYSPWIIGAAALILTRGGQASPADTLSLILSFIF